MVFKKTFKSTPQVVAQRFGTSSNTTSTQVGWTTTCYNLTAVSATGFSMNNVGYSVPNNIYWTATGYVA